jgi:hypothetical protein
LPIAVATPDEFRDFFVASAGVAGALVGLLFVAVSVTLERLEEHGHTQIHRVRARAALTAFTNALTVSLFALIPGVDLGWSAFVVGVIGSLFVAGALMSLVRVGDRSPGSFGNALFLVSLQVVFVIELLVGLQLINHAERHGPYETLCLLVAVCFLIGIGRSWELIGGPSIGFSTEIRALARQGIGNHEHESRDGDGDGDGDGEGEDPGV